MQIKAETVEQYLAALPEDRRAAISKVRAVIRKNLPKGYKEQITYGMIGWVVPHKLYPAGYHTDPKQPLPFAALASQKNYMSLYLMANYMRPGFEAWLRTEFEKRGKRLDMGKSCVRFKKLEDLPLDVLAETIAAVPVADYIMHYEDALRKR